MKPKVYVAVEVKDPVKDYLRQFCEVRTWDEEYFIPRSVLLREITGCDGVMLLKHKIDEELLQHAPSLKVISNVSVGYNNFDIGLMKEHRIIGTYTPGVVDNSTADLVLALMLATARRIPYLDGFIRSGHWTDDKQSTFYGIDIHHATLGIIGLGRIGEAIAKRAHLGFDMNVIYHNRSRHYQVEKTLGAEYRSLEQLLKEADFVILMTPLTDETRQMMSIEQFRMMKKSAVFINASRGETVDQAALVRALQEGWIWGAGVDVFDREPIGAENPLFNLSNVVMTPHIGTATWKTRTEMALMAARNLVAALQGQQPENLVPELKE